MSGLGRVAGCTVPARGRSYALLRAELRCLHDLLGVTSQAAAVARHAARVAEIELGAAAVSVAVLAAVVTVLALRASLDGRRRRRLGRWRAAGAWPAAPAEDRGPDGTDVFPRITDERRGS